MPTGNGCWSMDGLGAVCTDRKRAEMSIIRHQGSSRRPWRIRKKGKKGQGQNDPRFKVQLCHRYTSLNFLICKMGVAVNHCRFGREY